MLFSIIVPVYNAENYIRNCLDSILSQSYKKFEIIVINDGSKDRTRKIVDSYSKQDDRINAYHFENSGVSVSRQRGISLSSGEYVLFVDSDDSINPELLDNIYKAINTYNYPDIVRYQSKLINDSNYKDHERYNFFDYHKVELTGMNALKTWSIPGKKYALYWLHAFKKDVFSNILNFPNLRCYEDVALIPLLIAHSQKVITIDYIGYNYTCNNPESLTNSKHKSAEESRARDFFKAYNYAMTNFKKIENVTALDLAFFTQDFNRRIKEKFNSLSDDLKEKLADLYEV